MSEKYTVIYYEAIGYRAGQYIVRMKRVKTKNINRYLARYALDVAFVFQGWPKKDGEK